MVDYSRRLLSCRFVYCKRAIPTPQSQEPCYYRIPDSLNSRYRRVGYLEVTLLCWPIAVALVFPRLRPEPFLLEPSAFHGTATPSAKFVAISMQRTNRNKGDRM